jgi:hypothetical protein
MNARICSLLIGALALLTPSLSAQRSASCATPPVSAAYQRGGSVSAAYHRGGYESSRVWIPGRYETVARRVWVPGPVRRVWVEPVYEWRFGHCGLEYVCVRQGYWRSVQLPGRYEIRNERVYRPGHWVARGSAS